jgi:hypothetical protein
MEPLINLESINAAYISLERDFLSFVSIAETVGYILAFFAFVLIIYLTIRLVVIRDDYEDHFIQHFVRTTKQQEDPRTAQWQMVKNYIRSEDEALLRMAIIEADTMLEDMVRSMGYQGITFGEMLKNIPRSDAPWLDAAWEAHRLRNILAHEGSRYRLSHREAYRAYKIYEGILYDNGYLS